MSTFPLLVRTDHPSLEIASRLTYLLVATHCTFVLLDAFHSRTVQWSNGDATSDPSGEKATVLNQLSSSSSFCVSSLVDVLYSRTIRSPDADATSDPV